MDKLRVCAKIDLDAVTANIHLMHERMAAGDGQEPGIFAVVKTDAYGHGALPIARHIANNPHISGFAVATFEEAMELYEGGIRRPILILGYTFASTYREVVRCGIRPTIFSWEMARDYAEAADAEGKAVCCHIKIDTGMGRIGYPVDEDSADEIAGLFREFSRLIPEGIFTHFARADEMDKAATGLQLARFAQMLSMLDDRGIHFIIRHASNSAAILESPAAYFDRVRSGIILYGLLPSDEVGPGYALTPALSLHSHIVMIKEVAQGTPISYGGTYVTDGRRRIATVPVGYGDGYARGLSNKGSVLIRGKRAPIVGRICMDQCMVDVTAIPEARLLDEVTLIGRDGAEEITLEEAGALSGRFNYEFACDLGNRIPRLYYADGELIDTKEYF